jgi:polyvinyl alcohol dehydrogenase (cytochrome)
MAAAAGAAAGAMIFASQALSQNGPPAPGGPPPTVRMGLGVQGEMLFNSNCVACHTPAGGQAIDPRAPNQETLRQYTPERIHEALTTGKMQVQGASLTDPQRRDIAEWLSARRLGAAESGDAKTMKNRCGASPALAMARPSWNGWSASPGNARFQTAAAAGLKAADLPKLKLKWAFGIPNGVETYSQPTVVGGRVYFGSDSGQVYSVDAATGCVYWSYLAGAGVRSAPAVAAIGKRQAVYFNDMKANVYAVDAQTGAQIWTASADDQPLSRITGAPTISGGKVFVATSSSEEISGLQNNYECCRNRGTVSAFDAATGQRVWKFYTIPEPAKVVGTWPDGRRKWASAGVSSWSAPTADPKRGVIYITTGDSFTEPAEPLSDAIVALDMNTGKVAWSHQEVANDAYMTGCGGRPGPNCPATNGPDYDFAASSILQTLPGGKQLLVAGHKGGGVVALDPDKKGAVVWRAALSAKPPTAKGDIVYGGAADQRSVYWALQETSALAAVDLANGKTRWSVPVKPPADRAGRIGSAAAVTVIPGVAFNGGWDGVLRAFSTADGKELWTYDTVKAFPTVNGVEAKGGSMGAPGATVAGGMLFVGSGYVGISNGVPGNVMLAFSVDGR